MSKNQNSKALMDINKEITNQMINQISLNCREIGMNYFKCVENNVNEIKNVLPKDISYEEILKTISEKIIPSCIEKFDVQKCMNSISPSRK